MCNRVYSEALWRSSVRATFPVSGYVLICICHREDEHMRARDVTRSDLRGKVRSTAGANETQDRLSRFLLPDSGPNSSCACSSPKDLDASVPKTRLLTLISCQSGSRLNYVLRSSSPAIHILGVGDPIKQEPIRVSQPVVAILASGFLKFERQVWNSRRHPIHRKPTRGCASRVNVGIPTGPCCPNRERLRVGTTPIAHRTRFGESNSPERLPNEFMHCRDGSSGILTPLDIRCSFPVSVSGPNGVTIVVAPQSARVVPGCWNTHSDGRGRMRYLIPGLFRGCRAQLCSVRCTTYPILYSHDHSGGQRSSVNLLLPVCDTVSGHHSPLSWQVTCHHLGFWHAIGMSAVITRAAGVLFPGHFSLGVGVNFFL